MNRNDVVINAFSILIENLIAITALSIENSENWRNIDGHDSKLWRLPEVEQCKIGSLSLSYKLFKI